jgi:CheY-like chemotaxis protein/CHASE3 domain sensor protein
MDPVPSPETLASSSAVGGPRERKFLPQRTFVGFVVAVVAIVLLAALSWEALRRRTETAMLVTHTFEVVEQLQELVGTIKDAETGQRGYLLTGEESYLAPYDSAIASTPRQLEALRDLVGDNPEQRRRVAEIDGLLAQKYAELAQTITLRREGRVDEALQLVRSDLGKDLMDRVRARVGEMEGTEKGLLELRQREFDVRVFWSTVITSGGLAILLLLVGGAAWLSSRDYRAQQMEAWLRTGQGLLAAQLQGDHDVEVVGARAAEFLATYLDAPMSVVYYGDASKALRRVGGHAAPAADGELAGLTLQAFASGRVISVGPVPDDYFAVGSGLGASRPTHLAVVPTFADGDVNGVLELAFFRRIASDELELLERVRESIGAAMRSAEYRRGLRELLDETRRQSEELQTQQEELSVQNEELEQQTAAQREAQARLESQQAELEQINTQLEEQADSLAMQRDNLARAQRELQQANEYKSEFLANMSHELRTPLNSSLILAKLLVENREGTLSEEQVRFAHTIYTAGNDLLTLINDILDLSKIEAGKLDVRPDDVVLRGVVDDLRGVFEPIAQDKRIDLSFDIALGAPPSIRTDPTRLQQILKNLLSNALKFTEAGGVSLRITREADGVVAFVVSDTGIGIPREQHDAIFEAFRQADGTTNRKYGGTGLGLSISRDLARLLGGELRLHSEVGRGSTFTLLVPEAGPAVLRPVRAPEARSTAPMRAKAVRSHAPTQARSILVIEDDAAFAGILADLARELDFQPVVASDAERGLAMAREHRPSGIVLDIGLPDRSGLSVLDVLKRDPATRHIPVHVISAADHAQAALAMGAAGYAIKPVGREAIVDALRRIEDRFTPKVRRVLVVEDDDVHRDSTARLLRSDGVEVMEVATAAEAMAQLEHATFDCMVLDLTLPDRTGYELLEEVSAKERYSFPPVIVYTGRSISSEEERQLQRFSSSIIIKGARSPERLLDEVTLFLHQVESELPPDRQRMLRDARQRDAAFEGRRVLVVEDDVRNIYALTSVLERRGATVDIARNGREALDVLAASPSFDLVLMDVMMPEMDGLEATREIRKRPALAKLPIIALTAKAMPDDREQCLAAGANDYVAKPLDVDKLLSLARVWMKS